MLKNKITVLTAARFVCIRHRKRPELVRIGIGICIGIYYIIYADTYTNRVRIEKFRRERLLKSYKRIIYIYIIIYVKDMFTITRTIEIRPFYRHLYYNI